MTLESPGFIRVECQEQNKLSSVYYGIVGVFVYMDLSVIITVLPVILTSLALVLSFSKDRRERQLIEENRIKTQVGVLNQLQEHLEKTFSIGINKVERKLDKQTDTIQKDIQLLNTFVNKLSDSVTELKTRISNHEKLFSHEGAAQWLQEISKSIGTIEANITGLRDQIQHLQRKE